MFPYLFSVRIGNVVVGEAEIDNLSTSQTGDVLVIQSITIHEDFDPETLNHNIALVKLDRSVRLREGIIETLNLATGDEDYTSQAGTVTGWGGAGKLTKAQGTVLSDVSCKVRYNNLQGKKFILFIPHSLHPKSFSSLIIPLPISS